MFRRVLHVDGLMRCRVSHDGRKLIVSTTDGYLMVVHDLDLNRLTRDLLGFDPRIYHALQQRDATAESSRDVFRKLFTARRNRVEMISDFPLSNAPSIVPSLEVQSGP